MRALVDPRIGGQRDDEDIAVALGLLEVAQVADMEQVEDAVTVDDLLALVAQAGEDGGEVVEVLDLPEGRSLRSIRGRKHLCHQVKGNDPEPEAQARGSTSAAPRMP